MFAVRLPCSWCRSRLTLHLPPPPSPVAIVSSYAPEEVKRDDILEIKRNKRLISVIQFPVYVEIGDAIRIKRADGAITLSFGNGKRQVVKYGGEPYIVPDVITRRDWRDLFKRRRLPNYGETEALTADADFRFALPVAHVPLSPKYLAVQLSMQPSSWGIPSEPNNKLSLVVKPWARSARMRPEMTKSKTGVGIIEVSDEQSGSLLLESGTPPFTLKLSRRGGATVTITPAGSQVNPELWTTGTPLTWVHLNRFLLRPGWVTVQVSDAKDQKIHLEMLVVDPKLLRQCPFVSVESAPTIDVAVVCDAWREQQGRQVSPPDVVLDPPK